MSEDVHDIAPSVPVTQARFEVVRNDSRGSHRWLVDDEDRANEWADKQRAASHGRARVEVHKLTIGRAA